MKGTDTHGYLIHIPNSLWKGSNQKARARGMTLRAYMLDLLRRDLDEVNPNDLIPVLDLHAYFEKLDKAHRTLNDLLNFIDERRPA